MDLLKDNYWKVKTAACIAIGCLGEQAASQSLSLLLKVRVFRELTLSAIDPERWFSKQTNCC